MSFTWLNEADLQRFLRFRLELKVHWVQRQTIRVCLSVFSTGGLACLAVVQHDEGGPQRKPLAIRRHHFLNCESTFDKLDNLRGRE